MATLPPRSTGTARVHHAARRRGGGVPAQNRVRFANQHSRLVASAATLQRQAQRPTSISWQSPPRKLLPATTIGSPRLSSHLYSMIEYELRHMRNGDEKWSQTGSTGSGSVFCVRSSVETEWAASTRMRKVSITCSTVTGARLLGNRASVSDN